MDYALDRRRLAVAAGGLSLALAVSAVPFLAEAASSKCGDAVRGALYPAEITEETSPNFEIYAAWLCTRNFTQHDQALSAGMPPGALVYGVPLESGGSFRSEQHEAWRRMHCGSEVTPASLADAESEMGRLADRDALDARAECRGVESLDCDARVEGKFAIFSARYLEYKRSTVIRNLRVNGELADGPGWVAHSVLAAQPRTYAHEIDEKRQPVTFELETRDGACAATAKPRKERRKLPRNRTRSRR